MGEILVTMFLSVDGVLQAPGAPNEDVDSGFRHGGWQAPLLDDESGAVITRDIERMDALLLGRKTYDIFAGYWPKQEGAIAEKLNSVSKYVASRSRPGLDWDNATLIHGDVAKELPNIKRKHNEIHVIGSGNLVQTLLKHDLADRFNLWVYPVVLGSGKRLFAEGSVPAALELVQAKHFPKGAVLLEYRRVGKPTYGVIGEAATA